MTDPASDSPVDPASPAARREVLLVVHAQRGAAALFAQQTARGLQEHGIEVVVTQEDHDDSTMCEPGSSQRMSMLRTGANSSSCSGETAPSCGVRNSPGSPMSLFWG